MAKISKKEKKDASQATSLFLTLFGLFFHHCEHRLYRPRWYVCRQILYRGARMTFVFVIVPVVTVKMIASAWKDIAEHIVHKSDL
jgi:hypothetical protein